MMVAFLGGPGAGVGAGALGLEEGGDGGGRILIAGSASEFIQRFTAWRFREGARRVWMPEHCYGDYAHAAQAWGLDGVVVVRTVLLNALPGVVFGWLYWKVRKNFFL